ncbi:hypothetical protein EDD15DRAFT_2228610 [Pisolithus albus]|nr:hypothetical protein EDD15DRAFT_2228610 [Pisolithus albus]
MRPVDVHTVTRLREICELEELSVNSRPLSVLVSIAKGDLRGCLNTLEFIKSRCEDVTQPLIRRATAGMNEGDSTTITACSRRPRWCALCQSLEWSDRRCFAQYPHYRRHEADMSRYRQVNDWLVAFDTLSSAMYADGEFQLHGYLPYVLLPFHPLCPEQRSQRMQRDTCDWDLTTSTATLFHRPRTNDLWRTRWSNFISTFATGP